MRRLARRAAAARLARRGPGGDHRRPDPADTDAGEWLEKRVGPSPQLLTHTQLGDAMIYFSVALLVCALLLAFAHLRERRGRSVTQSLQWLIAAVVILVSVATGVQVYRIGDSGANATWGDQMAQTNP